MTTKTYETYVDSKLSYIGEIPSHWNVSYLKYLTTKKGQYGANCEPEVDENKFDYRYIRITDIDSDSTLKDKIVYLSENDAKEFILNENDILFARSGATVGKSYLYDKTDGYCCFAGYLIRYNINTKILQPKFLLYFTFSKAYYEWIKLVSTQSTIPNVSAEKYNQLMIPFPDINEQELIVDYLDKQITKFNVLLAKNKQLIVLLNEKKIALINQVVTKGLDLNVSLKDSKIDWIGDIPEHWELKKFRHALYERNEKNNPIKSKERLSLSIDKGVTLYAEKTTNLDRFKDDFTQYKLAYEGDLILNSMNMIVGAVGVSRYFGCVSPVYYTYYDETSTNIVTNYCDYLFKTKTIKKFLKSIGNGIMSIDRGDDRINTCRLKVSRNDLNNMIIPFPPLNEQIDIINFLNNECEQIDYQINLIHKHIKLLNEYKISLITNVITGKIDVRGEEI